MRNVETVRANLLDRLPEDLRTPELLRAADEYRRRVDAFEKEQAFHRPRYFFRRFRSRFWDKRSFVQDFVRNVRDTIAPTYAAVNFNHYLKLHEAAGGTSPVDQYDKPLAPQEPHLSFRQPGDLEFLDLIYDLSRKHGIQLILYFPPDRVTCPSFHLEPCNSNTFEPVKRYFSAKGVPFIDLRGMEFIAPRDTLDGIHPSISAKLKISEAFFDALEKLETQTAR